MKVVEYDQFVRKTDQYKDRLLEDRQNIALYGLVGEIGSLMSAVKKQLLASPDASHRTLPNDEIEEELGDIIWYCFNVVQAFFPDENINIFRNEIRFLKRMLNATDGNWLKFQLLLGKEKKDDFLAHVDAFPKTPDLCFGDFQKLAFKTARTEGAVLREVCLSILWQHGAEILRHKLPDEEKQINDQIKDRDIKYILGGIAWHVSAVSTIYGLSLDRVIMKNMQKLSLRQEGSEGTPLHDSDYPEAQKLPRIFDVSFLSIGPRHSRMYFNGKRLGDDLTDNAYDPDGYRFHDVMHLANAAKLGWSPVLRKLLDRKRKRELKIDEVEDGARAQIVEEAVVKAIHSEGLRLAAQRQGPRQPHHQELFPDAEDISYRFLKFIQHLVLGLEVYKNTYREWEGAILEGYKIFHELNIHGQGTVSLNLETKTISYYPHVYADFSGPVSGTGSSTVTCGVPSRLARFTKTVLSGVRRSATASEDCLPSEFTSSAKLAIIDSLGLDATDRTTLSEIEVLVLDEKRVSVIAKGGVRHRIWDRGVVCFRTSFLKAPGSVACTAVAISDL